MPILTPRFKSRVLADNPLGDPAERSLVVYLPAIYDAQPTRRFGVVVLLAGFSGRGQTFLNDSAWDENIEQRLDRLMATGRMRPLIVVMPDCRTRYGGSQYINSSATGRYEDYLVEELVPFVDATFRTIPTRDFRAVAGKSSGGYGATVLAMRHPGVFGLAADHSGDKYFELSYRSDIPRCLAGLARYEGSVAEFLRDFPHPPHRRGKDWFATVNLIAMASCYSPRPASATGFDLPIDTRTGEWLPDVWARWLQHDPVEIVGEHADALRSLRLYYLDCGRADEYLLQYGNRVYSRRLTELRIPHRYEEFDGAHSGTSHRYDVALPALAGAMPAAD